MKAMLKKAIFSIALLSTVSLFAMDNEPNERLVRAMTNNNLSEVKAALKDGANPNYMVSESFGGSLPDANAPVLSRAASNGNIEIVEELLKAGANVNTIGHNSNMGVAQGGINMTPVDFAWNHPEIAKYLREHGGKTAEELGNRYGKFQYQPQSLLERAAEAAAKSGRPLQGLPTELIERVNKSK